MALKKNSPGFVVKRRRLFEGFINFTSFNQDVRHLVEILNNEIASPESVVFRPNSHPAGFVRLITKRRLTIAEAYIKLVSMNHRPGYTERIDALKVLMHHVWHSKNLSMPLNTARVQIALMKRAVKSRDNRRIQLELMSDFARASYGQTAVIRRLLREHNLIEVPETGLSLEKMNLGWDDHVHDSMTEGRKSPSQLVLDAFIKGISRITVAYYNISSLDTFEEIFLAGSILGIRVQIGLEFSVGPQCSRLHYLYIPPQRDGIDGLKKFFQDKNETLVPFWEGLLENASRRHKTVSTLLDTFNDTGLEAYNEPYEEMRALQMAPLSWDGFEKVTSKGQSNRIHLGQLIYQTMKPVALKRLLYHKNMYRSTMSRSAAGTASVWEVETSKSRYEQACEDYEQLTPKRCTDLYVANQKQVDYPSAFLAESEVLPRLSQAGGYIVFIHPMSMGFMRGVQVIMKNYKYITDVEIFNLVDAMQRDPMETRRFAAFLEAIQYQTVQKVQHLFKEWRIAPYPDEEVAQVLAFLQKRPFYMRCSSDAVGWSANIPGMGFVHENTLSPSSLKLLKKMGNASLPQPVSNLLQRQRGAKPDASHAVYMLSTVLPSGVVNLVGDEPTVRHLTLWRYWRYLHTNARSLVMASIGFVPAYYILGIEFAILWFVITSFRNAVVDLISSSGAMPLGWSLRDIDRENLGTSLFFTGFSVPILYYVKMGFDELWAVMGLPLGFWFTFSKFWCISFSNGLYLVSHNTLRGFDKAVIRGNFFRSVLSWPLATLGSYGLTPFVPDIVQAKIWSEVVGGLIEGTGKNLKQHKLAGKALLEVYRQFQSAKPLATILARLDVLFFFDKYHQGRRALKRFMSEKPRFMKSLAAEDAKTIRDGNAVIYNVFSTEGSLESLSYTVLKNYPEENLTTLIDFLGEAHDPFVEWLGLNYERHDTSRHMPSKVMQAIGEDVEHEVQ